MSKDSLSYLNNSSHRFSYVKYDERATALQADFKAKFERMEQAVDYCLPESRAKSLVMNRLEEAYMWIGKAIRDEQIARLNRVDDQPERDDS